MVLAPAPIALALLALCTSTIPSYIFSSSYVAFCWDNARAQRSHIALCCRPVSASLHGSCCLCRASDKLLPPPSRAAGASWLRSAYRSLSSHISHRSRPGAPSTTLLPPSLLLLPPNRSSAPTSLPPSLRNGRQRPCCGDRHRAPWRWRPVPRQRWLARRPWRWLLLAPWRRRRWPPRRRRQGPDPRPWPLVPRHWTTWRPGASG